MKIIDQQIVHNGNKLNLGHYRIEREISRGVNGIVYSAEDTLLGRQVAIKIWTKLKAVDNRDKVQQGILEARKAYEAKSKNVIEVYHAGIESNLFYVIMEYFDGFPLKEFLKRFPPLINTRLDILFGIMGTCDALAERNIFHGDLHSENILVKRTSDKLLTPEFKIIDFGTSHFTNPKFSLQRHIRLVIKLVDEVLSQFSIRKIYGYAYPKIENWNSISTWIDMYLKLIMPCLLKLGYSQNINSKEVTFHPSAIKFLISFGLYLQQKPFNREDLGPDWNEKQPELRIIAGQRKLPK
jgi:serine/threonine protein kinase